MECPLEQAAFSLLGHLRLQMAWDYLKQEIDLIHQEDMTHTEQP